MKMKEQKNISIGLRITPTQAVILDQLIESRLVKTRSEAVQYLIMQYGIIKSSK